MATKTKEKFDVAKMVTDNMIARLEEAIENGDPVAPWQKPWNSAVGLPYNGVSKKMYRGVNIFILAMQGYSDPRWFTFKQIQEKGGKVIKGQKSTQIVFWRILRKEEKDAQGNIEERSFALLRYYNVFNAEQTEGLDLPPLIQERDHTPIEACKEIVDGYKGRPTTLHGYPRACYIPLIDEVNMPKPEAFRSDEEYYGTLFHEYIHSTGHAKRLKRQGIELVKAFGDEDYSKEELVAEMGAAILCAMTGIDTVTYNNSEAYLRHWIGRLKDDVKLLVQAGGQAQKAVDHILGVKWDDAESAEEG